MHDIHAFYGSNGSQEELDRRITRLMESVATMGADRDLDVVPDQPLHLHPERLTATYRKC